MNINFISYFKSFYTPLNFSHLLPNHPLGKLLHNYLPVMACHLWRLWYPNLAHQMHSSKTRHFSEWTHDKQSEHTILTITLTLVSPERLLSSEGYPDTGKEQEWKDKGKPCLTSRAYPRLCNQLYVNLNG